MIKLWQSLLETIIRRIVLRCPELKAEAKLVLKDLKKLASVSLNEIALDNVDRWKRLNSVLRGQPVSKETALESAIKLEMKLLSNPKLYPPQSSPKIKDHLLAWLYLNPKIKITILGRKTKVVTPLTKLGKIKSTSKPKDEIIDISGFQVSTNHKLQNIDLVQYRSAVIGELANAASEALNIQISDRLIRSIFK